MEKSSTAIRLGIKNKAGAGEIKNLGDLCYEILEPVRINLMISLLQLHLVSFRRTYAKQ